MSIEVQAAIFRAPNEPMAIETITVDEPLPNEVRIRTVASGVCHSDLHVYEGIVNAGRPPLVLGHEGAGIVESVGSDVDYVAVGDHVVTCLSGFCGRCEQCLGGFPNLCVANPTARARSAPSRLALGEDKIRAMINIGAFAEMMLVHENSVVKIDPDIPLDVACLVGCGVLTGVGAAIRTAAVTPGQTVAVFGCGGVGLSVIQGAVIAGASRVIAVDRIASKLELARRLGATDVVDAGSIDDPADAIRELTGGRGVDHAFEAVGVPDLVTQATRSLAIRGTCTIVGVFPDGAVLEIPFSAIRPECKVQTCRMGSNQYRTDIPRYLDFNRQGRLHLDDMISDRPGLDGVNDAFAALQVGEGARTVLTFPV